MKLNLHLYNFSYRYIFSKIYNNYTNKLNIIVVFKQTKLKLNLD
jgi:hypothetical protein